MHHHPSQPGSARHLDAGPDTAPGPGAEPSFMSVREVARYLRLNEKKVYELASGGQMPATKVTGKWLFPRELVDRWLMETSHNGALNDRLIFAGSDDPLLERALGRLLEALDGASVVCHTSSGLNLSLSLLARRQVDVCMLRAAPPEEALQMERGVMAQYSGHRHWALVRAFRREHGLLLAPDYLANGEPLSALFEPSVKWVLLKDGLAGHRLLREAMQRAGVSRNRLHPRSRVCSEREAAARVAMGSAHVAPGARSTATEFGLDFHRLGWEVVDLVLDRSIYFRHLFQQLLSELRGQESHRLASMLGGYQLEECGQIVWSG